MDLDAVQLNFSEEGAVLLNGIIGLIIFGIALDLTPADFTRIIRVPKGPIVGLLAQFFLLPFFTYLLTLALQPPPSVALGMILVGSCPGGNLSNFLTHFAKGNAALSVTMTAVSTLAAVFMTPFNLALYGGLNEATRPILESVQISFWNMFLVVLVILCIPLTAGMVFNRYYPRMSQRLHGPFKYFSIVVFIGFLAIAFGQNVENFLSTIRYIAFAVILHNAVALLTGYSFARLCLLEHRDVRAITIEVGIQNSALGLMLIFTFFNGLGGMALVAGLWGIWHVIAGLSLAWLWSRREGETLAHAREQAP